MLLYIIMEGMEMKIGAVVIICIGILFVIILERKGLISKQVKKGTKVVTSLLAVAIVLGLFKYL